MPNGRPGDHPLTDILNYGYSEFGEPIDGLVKQIAEMPEFQAVTEEVASILWEHTPFGRTGEKDVLVKTALMKLEAVKQRLVADDKV